MDRSSPTTVRIVTLVLILLAPAAYYWGAAASLEDDYERERGRIPELETRLEQAVRLSLLNARLRFQTDRLRAANPGSRSLQSRLEALMKDVGLGNDAMPTMSTLAAKTLPGVGSRERVRLILRNMTLEGLVKTMRAIEADERGMRIDRATLAAFGGTTTDRLCTLTLEVSCLTLE